MYKEAVITFEQGVSNVRNDFGILPFVTASYAYLGRYDEAKLTLDKWNGLGGRLSADQIYGIYTIKSPEVFDRFLME